MTEFKTLNTFQPESAKQVYEALTAAKTAFDKEEDYLYVLDTNALLKTYSFDSDSFNKLKIFFESNKGKIFATRTIELSISVIENLLAILMLLFLRRNLLRHLMK